MYNQATVSRLTYLAPSFFPNFTPVFDILYREVGDEFLVITQTGQLKANSVTAQAMGRFPRKILAGRHVVLSRRWDEGVGSASGLTITPGLPIALKHYSPEVVISMNLNAWTLTSLLLGYPTIVWWDGTKHTEGHVKPLKLRLRRWMAKRARAFVVSGSLAKEYVIQDLNFSGEHIFMPGICSEPPPKPYTSARSKVTRNDRPIRFLFVGRLIGLKGVKHLIKASSVVQKRIASESAFEIVLLGDGEQRLELEALARGLDIEHVIRFVGTVAPDAVWEHYANAHVFVMPTLQDRGPMVVNEAMSMGLPILLSKFAGWVPDLVHEGENGFVFDPKDHEMLAELMIQYIRNPQLINDHGSRSLELIRPFTPHRVAKAFLDAIEAVAPARI